MTPIQSRACELLNALCLPEDGVNERILEQHLRCAIEEEGEQCARVAEEAIQGKTIQLCDLPIFESIWLRIRSRGEEQKEESAEDRAKQLCLHCRNGVDLLRNLNTEVPARIAWKHINGAMCDAGEINESIYMQKGENSQA